MQSVERTFITYPTYIKYLIIACFIERLRVKEKRQIFHIMRSSTDVLDENTFFPQFGITAGEFSIWQVLSENRKPRKMETTT